MGDGYRAFLIRCGCKMEILSHLLIFFTEYGYIAVFLVLVFCGLGLPIPEDITLIAGGIICALSKNLSFPLSLNKMILISISGVLIGDSIMFFLGNLVGQRVTKFPIIKLIFTPRNYIKIQEKVKLHGDKALFFARFLPGLRAPIFVIYGISKKIKFYKFIFYDGLAALISVPLWVYLGYIFYHEKKYILNIVKKSEYIIFSIIFLMILIFLIYNYIKRKDKD